MKKAKRYMVASAALAGMFLIGSVMRHPGSQAKGAYSTPVQVMNTSASSVPNLDTEKLARIPYQSNSISSGCGSTCIYYFSAPPANTRLVVESLSGRLLTPSAVTAGASGEIDDASTLKAMVYFQAPLTEMQGTFSQAVVSMPMKAYVDAGHGTPFVVVNGRWNIGFFVLSGYLENCTITGCPPVQN